MICNQQPLFTKSLKNIQQPTPRRGLMTSLNLQLELRAERASRCNNTTRGKRPDSNSHRCKNNQREHLIHKQ